MKRLLVFILLLANSFLFQLNACGFYPWGEEVRFCYLKPKYFNFGEGYNYFNYTSEWYDYSTYKYNEDTGYDDAGIKDYEPNVVLWERYCNNKVAKEDIKQAIYKLGIADINKSSTNSMLRYLYAGKNHDAINYILFAKKCEQYTWNNIDPWEKNENKDLGSVSMLIKEAGVQALKTRDDQLKKRYLFLKTRLSFYYGKDKDIQNIYDDHFRGIAEKDLVYYWVMFYYTQTLRNPAEQNYFAAQVFANAPDKRFVVRSNYDRSIPIEETLQFAKSKQEAANIWLLHGVRITGKGIEYLVNIHKNNPSSKGLEFMLVREINKLEDWILTPQYSLFEPSTRTDYWENNNAQRILERVKIDREYAREVLAFLNTVDFSKTSNPAFWRMAQAYVAFMAKETKQAAISFKLLEKEIDISNPLYEASQLIKGLVLVANQEQGSAIIPDEVKPVILKQYEKGNLKYLFGLGRELEEKGNMTLAAMLFSKCDYNTNPNVNWGDYVNWKAKNNIASMYADYYWDYLTYIDACYSISKMKVIINDVNTAGRKGFDNWLYNDAVKNKHELYRILGTKYLRENNLKEARDVFTFVNKKDDFVFDENPFYKLKGTPEFTESYDKNLKVNRVYIMHNLIKILARAENPSEKNRDYYYFLAANCYYNMSFYGNAWNIRRRFMSSSQSETGFSDDDEFFQCKSAAKYYALAYKNAKKDKFRALCIRMMTECEKHKRRNEYDANLRLSSYDHKTNKINKYDLLLKKMYSNDYDELTSNCTAFSDYFKARR